MKLLSPRLLRRSERQIVVAIAGDCWGRAPCHEVAIPVSGCLAVNRPSRECRPIDVVQSPGENYREQGRWDQRKGGARQEIQCDEMAPPVGCPVRLAIDGSMQRAGGIISQPGLQAERGRNPGAVALGVPRGMAKMPL